MKETPYTHQFKSPLQAIKPLILQGYNTHTTLQLQEQTPKRLLSVFKS
jgi:hypothetical protein